MNSGFLVFFCSYFTCPEEERSCTLKDWKVVSIFSFSVPYFSFVDLW